MDYEEERLRLESSDLIFLFTDGVTEAMNRDGEMFTETGLEQLLNQMKEGQPEAVISRTMATVKTFTKRAEQSDDITMLAVQYLGHDR